ncbi:hypothetical protein QE382_000798 [Sphingobacterium zeae]|uniref:Uncharacterized protein n=1 Tax=Sphingobacterium zeae TaxID=1776859 RepID=A0ABU0U1J6_9SPHI|nr:hypothetical protein [Sphingobacterium zeae]
MKADIVIILASYKPIEIPLDNNVNSSDCTNEEKE